MQLCTTWQLSITKQLVLYNEKTDVNLCTLLIFQRNGLQHFYLVYFYFNVWTRQKSINPSTDCLQNRLITTDTGRL